MAQQILDRTQPSAHSLGEDDRKSSTSLSSPTSTSPEPIFEYTEDEERKVRRKLNMIVLPLLFLGFYVFQLERGNIANALTDDFMIKVGITQDQFNTGQALLFVGIILGELPSQYVLQWIGPQIWISFQVLAFGLVATFQAFQSNYASFLTTRILLGVTECGYIPGSLYTLSTFYKRSELATVTAVFFLGNTTASATSGLLAYGILPLGKRYTQLWGWQWLMIIEGSMAIFVSILIISFLPASPIRPRPLFLPIRYFNDREEQILARRVVLDDRAKADSSRRLTRKEITSTLLNWRIWPHVLMAIAYIAPTACLGTYGPTLIRGFKFDALQANALSSVAGWTLLVLTFVYGYASDRLHLRGPLVIGALSIALTFWIAFQQKSLSSDRWLKYGLQVMAQGFNSAFHPVNATWTSLNCRTPQERSVAMAMFIMAANSGALVGSQLLRGDDAPLYRRGFKVCVALMAFALGVGILQHVQYRLSNRRLQKHEQRVDVEAKQDARGEFRYII